MFHRVVSRRSLLALAVALSLSMVGAPARADTDSQVVRLLYNACDDIENHSYERAAGSARSSAGLAGVRTADDLLLQAVALEGHALKLAAESGGADPTWKGLLQEALELLEKPQSQPPWLVPPDSDPTAVHARIRDELARYSATGGLRGVPAEQVRPPHPVGVCRFYPFVAPPVGEGSTADEYPVDRCPLYGPMAAEADAWTAEGRCTGAKILADGLTQRCKELPLGYRLLGDANACDNDDFAAVAPYRSFLALGGSDESVARLVVQLEADLGSVTVRLQTDPQAGAAEVRFTAGGQLIRAAAGSPRHALVFGDIPPGKALHVAVRGQGFLPAELDIPALKAGDDVVVELPVEYPGLGAVQIVKFPASDFADSSYEVFADDRQVALKPGQSTDVTAGAAQLLVTNDLGRISVDLDVPRGGAVVVDPRDWVPSLLNLAGLPAGSDVLVTVDGKGDAESSFPVSATPSGGGPDEETGIELSENLRVGPLVGGKAAIEVTHWSLGRGQGTKFLKGGNVAFFAFPRESFSNYAVVRDSWTDHSSTIEARRRGHAGGTVAGIVGAIGGAVASALLVWQGGESQAAALVLQEQARSAPAGQVGAINAAFRDELAVRDGFYVAGAVSGGVAVAITGLTIGLGSTAKKRLEWRAPKAP